MGKTFTRNRDDENYRGDMKHVRQANKLNRKNRHAKEQVLDQHMEQVDDEATPAGFRKNDHRSW